MSRGAEKLLAQATLRSITVKQLVESLDPTDLVVYLTLDPFLSLPTATTRFVATAGGRRYVLISVNPRNQPDDTIQFLGHELQHAREIAQAPEVQNEKALQRFCERIGHRGSGDHQFETHAALDVGTRVRLELIEARPIAEQRPSAAGLPVM